MSHLETLLLNEIRKPLEALEKSHVGFIDEESSTTIYYKIDERVFAIEVREQSGDMSS